MALVATSLPANAATTDYTATQAVASVKTADETTLQYSDLDIVDFFVFGRGPIAQARPDLLANLSIKPQPDVPESVAQGLLDHLIAAYPEFHENVTVKAQAHDPYKAEESVKAFIDSVNAAAAAAAEANPESAATSKATANGWFYPYAYVALSVQVAATAVVAVSVLGVAAALVVFAYAEPGDASDLAHQNLATTIAGI